MGRLRVGLGRSLQRLRKAAGLTQEALAKRAGVDTKYIADLENARKSASLEVLESLMVALDAEPYEVFTFGLKSTKVRGAEEDLFSDLLAQFQPSQKRLAGDLIKAILRWQQAEK